MKKLCALFVSAVILLTTATSHAACAETDIACFRRGFLDRGIQIDSLKRELDIRIQTDKLHLEQINVLENANNALHQSLSSMAPALNAAERRWYEDERLWFGLGFGAGALVAIGLTVLGVWAVSQVRAPAQ